jgi:NifB/MoaA-like Fe-S oxidoreductase
MRYDQGGKMPENVPGPYKLELELSENFTAADLKKAIGNAINSEVVTALRNAQPTEKVTLITNKQFPGHIKKRPKKK